MKKQTRLKFQFLTMVVAIFLVIQAPFVLAQPTPPSGKTWSTVVSDDFNSFNTSTWGYGSTPWGSENQSACTIIPAADTYVSGGSLVLRSRKGPFTGATGTSFAYSSGWAWLKTWRTYGYVEIRAQYPNARGVWPAFWMLASGWPPEIDIAEYRGAPKNYMTEAFYNGTWYSSTRSGSYTGWHTYGLDWEPGYLKWYIDGTLVKTYTGTVPSTSMYVILSNGSDCTDSDGTGFPNYYYIDYFRWYQLVATKSADAVTASKQSDISIYPNPLVGEQMTIEGLSGTSAISFIDLNGKVVKEQQVNATGNAQINVNLKPGIYFVKIATSVKTTVKKLVIE